MRLDKCLVLHHAVPSRAKAKDLIQKNAIKINGKICSNRHYVVMENDHIEIESTHLDPYVSRSAYKLKSALSYFEVDVHDKIALDVGMSTGGFTQVLLESGAKEVFGVDVGHDQLHPSLKNNSRVKFFEGINVKLGLPFEHKFEIIVVDVSFISITKIVTTLKLALSPTGILLLLVKPQFEQNTVDQKRLILSEIESKKIAQQCRDAILKSNLICSELFEVPLKGKDGNQEYFLKCNHS